MLCCHRGASYNRYCFNDDYLPGWFADDEKKHFRPQLPVDKDTVERIKAQFRDIAARPIKKVHQPGVNAAHPCVLDQWSPEHAVLVVLHDVVAAVVAGLRCCGRAMRSGCVVQGTVLPRASWLWCCCIVAGRCGVCTACHSWYDVTAVVRY